MIEVFVSFAVVIVIAVMMGSSKASADRLRRRTEAEAAYRSSLAALKADPTNPDLREAALQKGREFFNLNRSDEATTVYDEMALMNDLSATCGAGIVLQASPAHRSSQSIEERLITLADLKAHGAISDAEYCERRHAVLNEI